MDVAYQGGLYRGLLGDIAACGQEDDKEIGGRKTITCTCLVCGSKWSYEDGTDEDLIRASCSPCGHQGLFKVKKGVRPNRRKINKLVARFNNAISKSIKKLEGGR